MPKILSFSTLNKSSLHENPAGAMRKITQKMRKITHVSAAFPHACGLGLISKLSCGLLGNRRDTVELQQRRTPEAQRQPGRRLPRGRKNRSSSFTPLMQKGCGRRDWARRPLAREERIRPAALARYNATWPWALPAGVKTAVTIRSMGTLRDQCAKVPRKCAKLRTSAPAPSHLNP